MSGDAMRRAPLIAVLALAAGCATMRSDRTVCPEYRELRCASAPECSFDRARGCHVCQCRPSTANPTGELPSGVPPDRR